MTDLQTVLQPPRGTRPAARRRDRGASARGPVGQSQAPTATAPLMTATDADPHAAAVSAQLGDVLRETRLLREQVTRTADLATAYRDAAAERARRITELHGELDAQRDVVAALRAAEGPLQARVARTADLERRLAASAATAKAAERSAADLRRQVEAARHRADVDQAELRRVRATLERCTREREVLAARAVERYGRVRSRRSVRLALWLCDRPSVRRAVRLLGRGRA